MTGHAEAAEERAELAMHTLAPARSPDRRLPPLLHRLQSCSTRSSCELRSPQAVEADYPLADPAAPAATPVRDDDGFQQDLAHQGQTPQDREGAAVSITIASDLLRLIPGEHDDCANDDAFPPSSFLSVSLCLSAASEIRQDEAHGVDADAGGPPDGLRQTVHGQASAGPKTWSQRDMENALDALRNHDMSLTKASAAFGIPSTTLWQRAHRLGIDTPKKEGPSKSWSEGNLHDALRALRTGTISANKASKAYGIPSSTLYKIARREGIRLAAPFNAAPTAWRPGDLERALQSIRSGHSSVQRASTEFGIPTGTLYGRCKREGIELSRSNPTPWSEDAMGEALEAVRVGQMSINQAAIHYNLPYSSLYGRFKRCKYESEAQARPPPGEPPYYRQYRQEAPDASSGQGCVPIS